MLRIAVGFSVFFLLLNLPIHGQQNSRFPFAMQGGQFLRNGEPVFLNIISYQPLEPGQAIDGGIREARIQDDLRRFRAFQGGSDPVLLRVYAQPTTQFPRRMPKSFYDGVRALDFWIIRDIYFQDDFQSSTAIARGRTAVDAVINEVAAAGAFDRIFAWEIGNEFRADSPAAVAALQSFICAMRDHVRARMSESGRESYSKWVTWASWSRNDPLRSVGLPVLPDCLDYISYNAYSYDPEHVRDQQAGPVTGTPYAGYLAALKDRYTNLPLVISESGLANSASAAPTHTNIPASYPAYRYGGMTEEQIAEGLADRFWDARLSGAIAGFGVFEWNDEWHKAGDPNQHANHPEEHFGLIRFGGNTGARFKLQADTVRGLFTLRFQSNAPPVALTAEKASLVSTGATRIRAVVPVNLAAPIQFRWEASRGRVIGDTDTVEFQAGGHALGPAQVIAVAIDKNGNARQGSIILTIQPTGPATIQILTLGEGSNSVARASGRVDNVDLDQFKLATYIQTDRNYVQPNTDMKSIWIGPTGYWWTPVDNRFRGRLMAWLVPKSYDPPLTLPAGSAPPGRLASASTAIINDADNDLLPDNWEPAPIQDRYSDLDGDGVVNLDEFLSGTAQSISDGDHDRDGLPDAWELLYLGTLRYGADDDPDGDGLGNRIEWQRGIHPGRTAADRDSDGLPDAWELRWLGTLRFSGNDDADRDGQNNRDAYELGQSPLASLPSLAFERLDATRFTISWPASATGYLLEVTTDLSSPTAWRSVGEIPAKIGDRSSVTATLGAKAQFFRLRLP